MSSRGFFKSPPTKLKSYTRDIAPLGFYFDVFSTDDFTIPIMPVPMRIDKITNGQGTYFILPNMNIMNDLFKEVGYFIDFKNFIFEGIKNLIIYSKKKYKEIIFRSLMGDRIIEWFGASLLIDAEIHSLTQDFSYLISEFLKIYTKIEKNNLNPENDHYKVYLIEYCENLISYFREKIESNIFYVKENKEIIAKPLYKEKKNKYYPIIIETQVNNLKKNKLEKMNFIPYLIYDDILDIFNYNKIILIENLEIKPFDLKIYEKIQIIKKGSYIDKINLDLVKDKLNLIKFELEKII
ncbi:MAG: hypothetical protein ACFE85_15055 [Candidatus Hodarchaeota archaeon]